MVSAVASTPACALSPLHGDQIGADFSALRDEQMIDDYHYTIFPNVTLNIHARGFWLFSHDFPTGARHLIQRAKGYDATIVNGAVLMRNGTHTGAHPGRVLRNEAVA